jgi:hypothetical protein
VVVLQRCQLLGVLQTHLTQFVLQPGDRGGRRRCIHRAINAQVSVPRWAIGTTPHHHNATHSLLQ